MSDYKNYFVGSGFPKELTQEDIETSYNAPSFFEEYEDKDTPETKVGQTLQEVFRGAKGSVAGVRKFGDTFNLFLGNVLMASGNESVGGQLVKTSRENLKRIQRDIDLNVIGMNDERRSSFATALGGAIPDFVAQIGLALTAGAPVALTAMTAKEFTGELAERTTKAKDYNAEKARENLVSSGFYAAGSAVLEKRLGLDPLVNKIFKGKRPLKAAIKGFFSEGGTEFLQGTLSTALQLKDGYVDWNEIPQEIKQNVIEGAIGGILGGTSSFGFALKNRAVLAKKLKERYGDAWGKNADKASMNVANALLSEASAEVVNELAVTSEMQNYHGRLYNKLYSEVGKQIEGMPFESELDRQEYLSAVSKSVADWTVSEALKRNIPVEDVLEVANVFMSKEGLRLKGLTEYEKALDKLETEEWMAKGERDFQKLVEETLSERKAEYEGLKGKARASIDSDVEKLYKDIKNYLSSSKRVNSRKQTHVSDIVKSFMSKNGYKGIGDLIPDKNTGNLTLLTTEEFSKQKNWGARKGKVVSYDRIIEHLIERGVLSEGATQNDLIDVLYNDPVIEGKEKFKTEEMAEQMDDLIRLAKIEDADSEQDAKQKIENYLLSEGASETKIDNIAKETLPNEDAYSVYEYWKREGSAPLDAYEIAIKEAYAGQYGFYEDLFYQESFNVADENARLDDIYPEYEGGTININGQERTVYNSNGERIAKSAEALQNFYKWFGDSKVVDEQGRPLVVYHGTSAEFDTFRKGNIFTTDNQEVASEYGSLGAMPLYIKLENPLIVDAYGQSFGEIYNAEGMKKAYKDLTEEDYKKLADIFFDGDIKEAKEWYPQNEQGAVNLARAYGEKPRATNEWANYARKEGYDGVIIKDVNDTVDISNIRATDYVAFNPNQIKSTSNRGAYSESENIYKQDIKGTFNKSTRIITLTKKADYSTLPHEFAHYFLQDALDYANSGLASDEYVESLKQTLKDFNGRIKEGVSATKATHEFFARQYERYLYENKADNEAVKNVFDTYEKFLKKCYNNANIPGSAPLSDAQVKFFNEHIRGEIPAPVVTPVSVDELRREEEAERFEMENVAEEATTEKPAEKETETKYVYPEAVEDEKGKVSRVYAKTLDILNRESLKYGVLHNEDQALMAAKIVEDLETARKMIDGEIPMPEGLLRTALMIAYEESVKETDFDEYNRVRRKHSLEQTRRGQEIQAEKIGENDITDVGYWLNNAEDLRAERAAKEFKRLLKKEDYKKSPTKALYDYIDEKVAQYAKEIENGASIQEVTDKIKNDLGVFYQVDVKETYNNVYDTVRSVYDGMMNLTVSEEEAKALNEKILKLKKHLGEVDLTKDINADAWQALKDVQDAYNALNPSSNLALMTSTVGRGAMLSAPATYVLNIVSNAETYLVEKAVRRIKFGTKETLVSDELKKKYDKQAKEAYNISGITLSTAVPEEIKKPSYQGERVLSSAGEGKVRELSRFVEKWVFKYGLGYPDMVFKNAAFIDTVDLLASKYAKKRAELEGRNAVDIANEVFEDATKIQPKTEIGAEIRKQAIQEALIVTFTNNSEISKASLKIRNVINSATGDAMLGDILMPFVKTPANVASLGLQYAFGSAYSVLNIKTIAENIRKGEMSDISRDAITYAMRNGLGMALALAVSSLLDDDDYIPPYASASMKDRELARLKNAPYNSIKFGNSYVSLDYFGVFAAPLVGALMAKRDDNIASYLKGTGYQAMQIPGLKEISSAYKTMETSAKDSGQALEDIKDATVDAIIARVVPNALTVVENMIDPYFRETRENKMLGRIAPFVLPEKQFLAAKGSVEKTFGDKLRLFLTGSRAKRAIDNDMTKELSRLNATGNGVTLTEVTRSYAFKNLPIKNRNEIQRMFIQGFGSQKGYSEQVENLIKTGRYKAMSDEDKKKEINKIRTKLINKLKKIFVSDKMAEN